MKFTLTVVALFSVLGRADAALRNSNAQVITSSDESESFHDTPKPAEDPHSFLSENGSSTTACAERKCTGHASDGDFACEGVDESKVGCGSCRGRDACGEWTGDSIGENSCTKDGSCYYGPHSIGYNSCNARNACRGATGYIPNNQCNTEDECAFKDFPALSQYKDDILEGICLSSREKVYTAVHIKFNKLPEDSSEACAQFCRQPSLMNGFQVGMQIGRTKCFCLYDGRVPNRLPSDAVERTKRGKGPVESSKRNPGTTCYPLKDEYYAPPSLNEPKLTID